LSCGERHESSAELAVHLAHTHRVVSTLTQPDPQFCFSCTKFFFSIAAWSAHCAWHLENLELSCGRVHRKGIVLKPFSCPHCLGDTQLPAYQRFAQFPTQASLTAHLSSHEDTDHCQHPLCDRQFDSVDELIEHMKEHNLKPFYLPRRYLSDLLRCKMAVCKNESFDTVKACFKHVRKHSVLLCPFPGCSHSLRTFRSFKQHMVRQHKIDELTCVARSGRSGGVCRTRFGSLRDLDTHLAGHAKLRDSEGVCKLLPDMSAFGISYDGTDDEEAVE
jgi:hypothetical protein